MTQYMWFIWSIVLCFIWCGIYISHPLKKERPEMLLVSLLTALTGFAEPLFVPEYWSPPSLFNLNQLTGFDIESVIFSFAAGGIVFSLYHVAFFKGHKRVSGYERHVHTHRFHFWAIWSVPIVTVLLFLLSDLNPIYVFIVAGLVGGVAGLYCRPDLGKKMLVSAVLFLILYYVYFLTLNVIAPGYVEAVWNLKAISGILITGVPLEELAYAFVFGFYWSSLYEHLTWKKVAAVERFSHSH